MAIVYVGYSIKKEMPYAHLFNFMNENMRLKYQAHFLSQGSKFLYLVALFLNQIGCPGNALQEGKKHWFFTYYLQLENEIKMITPVISHSTQTNIFK